MNPDTAILPLPPEVAHDVLTATQNSVAFFGFEMSRGLAAVIIALAFYYLGVIIGHVLRLNGDAGWIRVLLGSIPIALLGTPTMAGMVAERTFGLNIPLLDQFIRFFQGNDPFTAPLFWFGMIVVIGMFSWMLLTRLIVFARGNFGGGNTDGGAVA